jgi:hypothetical protein
MNEQKNISEKSKITPKYVAYVLQNKAFLSKIIVGLLVLVVLMSIFGILRAFTSSNVPAFGETDIADSLKTVGHLTTLEAKVAKIGVWAKISKGSCNFEQQYLIDGTINAGIDMTSFSASNVSYVDNTSNFTVKLPVPQLTNCDFDTLSYGFKSNMCLGVDTDDLDRIAKYVAQTDLIQDTLDGGLLARTERESIVLIKNLVLTLTGKEVSVEFIEPEEAISLPSSCILNPPPNFKQNDDGIWEAIG